MDTLKQELDKKYWQDKRKLACRLGLINTSFAIVYMVYVYLIKPNNFTPLIIYISIAMVSSFVYYIQLTKLGNEYQQEISELDDE